MINIQKGTKDVLPEESFKWQYVEKLLKEQAQLYNLQEIRTPTFEATELFLRGVGDTSDVVNKEMYTFLDKGERSITLKPEGTAGVVRSYIENGLFNQVKPLKLFYLTPVFRYERPQAGRLREHHQFGIEVFGSNDPGTDAEVIKFGYDIFKKFGAKVSLEINSIGCEKCRPKFREDMEKYLHEHEKDLCETCRSRIDKNCMRIIDCKEEACKKVCENAPSILDYLCDDCKEHFNKLQSLLKALNISFTVNPKIVRGLDYYTKTVFEFVAEDIGAKSTVCGGGRYDNLVEQLGGPSTQGVGFGLGIERLLLLLENSGFKFEDNHQVDVFIASFPETFEFSYKLVDELRQNEISAELDKDNRSIKAQFKYADRINAKYVITIGENEINSNSYSVKDMKSGEAKAFKKDELISFLKGGK